jgi:hypothetical protein
MSSSAVISSCGTYRYHLTRSTGVPLRWHKPMLFICLNPSTADSQKDDNTIRKCIAYAKREGCTSMEILNLFALRSTNPRALLTHPDPVGPENDWWIDTVLSRFRQQIVIAAWGTNEAGIERGAMIQKKYGPFQCLGMNRNGTPKHPLYLKNDQPLMELR